LQICHNQPGKKELDDVGLGIIYRSNMIVVIFFVATVFYCSWLIITNYRRKTIQQSSWSKVGFRSGK